MGQRRDGELLLVAEDRTDRKEAYRTRDAARADVFDTIRRHSTIGYLSPVEFERKVGLA
jgi:hypothetical protein